MHLLHQMALTRSDEGAGVTDLAASLRRVGAIAKRRGMVAVISDFRVESGWEDQLVVLARKHDVIVCEVLDPLELQLPNVGLLTVVDPGTGRLIDVPTHKAKVRAAYSEAAQQRRESMAELFSRHGIDHIELRTDHNWLDDVVHFVAKRKHRLLATAGRRRS